MSEYSLCWLDYKNPHVKQSNFIEYAKALIKDIEYIYIDTAVRNAVISQEISVFFSEFFVHTLQPVPHPCKNGLWCTLASDEHIQSLVNVDALKKCGPQSFMVYYQQELQSIVVVGNSELGLLYGVFRLIGILQREEDYTQLSLLEEPKNPLRLLNHWDNMDGSIERGYAGNSIFFKDNQLSFNRQRIHDYARLLASIGINGIVINNVNVKDSAPFLISDRYRSDLVSLAAILRPYGVRVYLSVNFMSPVLVGNLDTADPLDPQVISWWQERVADIYAAIPDFGGFLVKADSEYNPGPHTYGRTQAEGANMLARALRPFGGTLIWRAFVYKLQDWRDTSIDRARAAFDIFFPLDGSFEDNVILQIKNGPLDFQVREPVSPLFGTMKRTNQILELQITQEYTGHQIDLCYLAPQWSEILHFDPHIPGVYATVASIVSGSVWNRPAGGMAGVANIGNDPNWTGHWLAQANWYAFGRLAWDPGLQSGELAREWVVRSLSNNETAIHTIVSLLERSWTVYEQYTTPFGLGWMVTPGTHYGPSPEGYEYSIWGTYHRSDTKAIGVDRTSKGTGYSTQYEAYWKEIYDDPAQCPESLIMFFHRLPYTFVMKNGKTLIQNYYDLHFSGYEAMLHLRNAWRALEPYLDYTVFSEVLQRFDKQEENARQWRDVINSFFYRKTGIPDEKNRPIY
ncbi:MAG: alpha-glucuronidase family glycosyl hydrolase [Termitinemataceae bacterium]